MTVPGGANTLLLRSSTTSSGYSISRSLRFNSADSAYLSRTPASAGNRKTWTWAGWVKRAKLGTQQNLFHAGVAGVSDDGLFLSSGDAIILDSYGVSSLTTSQVFRDASAWYHIVWTWDTDNATASDRSRLYVNGARVTAFSSASYPGSGATSPAINNATLHTIGSHLPNFVSDYPDAYLADIHFIDGQALDPTSFGEFSATTGVWVPKAYTGSYGTNGFHLDFADNSSNTATTLGKDTSGAGNNWTPNNLSVTAGAGNDSLIDVPVNGSEVDTGLGNQVRGNYCTLNPLHQSGATLSNGNLDCSIVTGWVGSTVHASSGKWYAEFTLGSGSPYQMFGVCTSVQSGSGYPWQASTPNVTYYAADGRIYVDGVNTGTSGSASATVGDIISVALDADAKSVAIRKNNTLLAAKTIGAAASYMFYVSDGGATVGATFNAGQRPFAYTAPSGFKALCTANLPAPVVTKPSDLFDVKLYTGNGSTQTISGLGFSPDLVWVKQRSAVRSHWLTDTVRGNTKLLSSDQTIAEITETDCITSFNSDGFSLDADAGFNASSGSYAAWAWDAGTTTSTNTVGSITSQVRANASAGFSIVNYTGNLSSSGTSTVGHGLGVAPSMVITKKRDGSSDWVVQHSGLPSANNLIYLQSTAATNTSSYGTIVAPTSSVFTIAWLTGMGDNGSNYIAYCFAPVAGYSSFGSYTGNGSADGPFVFCNFRPRWILIKRTDSAGFDWIIFDSLRLGYNYVATYLQANLSNTEGTDPAPGSGSWAIDILSNGFKHRDATGTLNSAGATYIYCAFAESPFAANNRAR